MELYWMGAIMNGSNLTRARLTETSLKEVLLGGGILVEALLEGVTFEQCYLRAADFRHSSTYGLTFILSDLEEVKLSGCDLTKSYGRLQSFQY